MPDRASHFDVVIVGAGLSGIGAACRLQSECPDKTYVVLEGRAASGGTWDLFRYPGIRSDSDMFTLGYPFRPWSDPRSIADGPTILGYLRDTARQYGVDRRIEYSKQVEHASWDSTAARWTLSCRDGASYTCSFLYVCAGYYRYDGGYLPDFPGLSDFNGTVVHPQDWPEGLDYTDRRVVVIGSGATAITLVPALAERAAHVTMLQRSPSYVATLPAVDPVSAALGRHLPRVAAARLSRWKSVVMTTALYQYCRRRPRQARKLLMAGVAGQLPDGYPVDVDFNPTYDPWDQRMCVVPDGDLFGAITAGRASVVTGEIDSFVAEGVALSGGEVLPADIVVAATGLRLEAFGGISITVDGSPVAPGDTMLYRGCMLSDVPNLATCIGYTNASWTLRADLTSRYVCRLLTHMDRCGYATAIPRPRGAVAAPTPLLDLTSGYVKRGAGVLPKQGYRRPWRLRQNYLLDFIDFKLSNLAEGIEFSVAGPAARPLSPTKAAAWRP